MAMDSDARRSPPWLLVSVSDAEEAAEALHGGADVIDAKDPALGALGAVALDRMRAIRVAVDEARLVTTTIGDTANESRVVPTALSGTANETGLVTTALGDVNDPRLVTAALGDASDEHAVECQVRAYVAAGAAFVKIGFRGIVSNARVSALIRAACRGARVVGRRAPAVRDRVRALGGELPGVIAVAYADAARVGAPPPPAIARMAAHAGAAGVLLDTADKDGPGLRALVDQRALIEWVADAHERQLLVAIAGRLTADDLTFARASGADIVGVRGAACEGGRAGRVTADRVGGLRMALNAAFAPDQQAIRSR